PTAKNIAWNSINFKTIVEWDGKPTDFVYTVEIRNQYVGDWKKKCIYTSNTECDVTDLLQDVNATYDLRITSEMRSEDEVTEEFPYADGPSFNPHDQTIIGKPAFESFNFNEDHTQLKVVVADPITPYKFGNKTSKTVRDIFGNDFQYTLFYRKAGSTGKKEAHSATNEIVISTSKGEGYCFFVRATILSRRTNRYSQDSDEKCASSEGNELDFTILVAVIVAVVLVIVIIILLVVVCVCRKKKEENTKETEPLSDV
ncbi:PREDICTED: tissue factor, partial [Nanorana parkeri]|uniref:tissue factor n=1 Tax=Nanorana parkeri TaxID=125878 RepID=UPI0008543C05